MEADDEIVADLIDRLQHSVLINPNSTSTTSSTSLELAGYCADLAVRLWSLAVIDHQRGLGLLGFAGGFPGGTSVDEDGSGTHLDSSAAYLLELHRRVGKVVSAAGGATSERQGGDVVKNDDELDAALYALAVAVGMPSMGKVSGRDGRVLSMSHIASVVQCMVMMIAGNRRGAGAAQRIEANMETTMETTMEEGDGGHETSTVDGLRRLRRAARRLRAVAVSSSTAGSAAVHSGQVSMLRGDRVTLEALCEEVLEGVTRAKAKDLKYPLPHGFFDVMIPYGRESLNEAQEEMLARVATALQEETSLRRKMMVDRAVATLKTFSIRQEAVKVGVLDSLTEEARARMELILEGQVAGVEEAWRMVKGEVVSLLVERGVGEEHGSVNNRIKTVQIGHVPDRGGRPEGVSRQAALMPEWKAREAANKAGGGGRGGGRGNGNKKQRK